MVVFNDERYFTLNEAILAFVEREQQADLALTELLIEDQNTFEVCSKENSAALAYGIKIKQDIFQVLLNLILQYK